MLGHPYSICSYRQIHISEWITYPTQSSLVSYSFCANLLHSLIMWLIVSSLSPHNLHLLFCCILSILPLMWLVLTAFFYFYYCYHYYYYYLISGFIFGFLQSLVGFFYPRPHLREGSDFMYFLLPATGDVFLVTLIVFSKEDEYFCKVPSFVFHISWDCLVSC